MGVAVVVVDNVHDTSLLPVQLIGGGWRERNEGKE
jgi:hypothetical protein